MGKTKRDSDGISDHYEAIGKVVVAAAHLDDRIAEQIRFLVTAEPFVARILTAKLGFRSRIDLLGALIAYRTTKPEILRAFKKFATRAEAAMDRRNFFAHSLWGASANEGKISVGTHKQSRKHGIVLHHGTFEVDSLLKLADELDACVEDASGLSLLLLDYAHGVYFVRPGADGQMETGLTIPKLRDEDD